MAVGADMVGADLRVRPFPFYTPNPDNRWADMVRADTSVRPYRQTLKVCQTLRVYLIFDLPFFWHERFVVHDLHDITFLSQHKQAMFVRILVGIVFDNNSCNCAV